MPLIIITGLPCSGKSHRAQQIRDGLAARIASDPSLSKRRVQVVPSHHASADIPHGSGIPDQPESARDTIYNSPAQEKTARAEEFSAIKRAVNKDNIVIADGLNYIKGYRYQLWCEAKAAGTRCCVVHVAAQEDECKSWNRERLRAWGREGEAEGEAADLTHGRLGKNAIGDLIPESHTAVYGDRAVEKVSRSRSSSMDGDDGEKDTVPRIRAEDTMTLKSLYISNKPDNDPSSAQEGTAAPTSTSTLPSPPSPTTVASSTPPPPTSAPPYRPATLTSLFMRYEPPSPFSRWDTPLFTVPSADAHPPYSQIWDALYPPTTKHLSKKALSQLPPQPSLSSSSTAQSAAAADNPNVKPHAATVLPRHTASDALQLLESTTAEVARLLLARARELGIADGGDGGTVAFALPSVVGGGGDDAAAAASSATPIEVEVVVPPGTPLSQPMLQRLRRTYTAVQRGGIAHGQGYVSGRRGVVEGFVRFLAREWGGE